MSLPLLYPELKSLMDNNTSYEWEVLFVNDGSKDNTIGIIKDLRSVDKRINFVDLTRNFGKENAMLAGFDYVTGDCMVIIDADLQDPPSLIPQMLEYWEQGYDDVYARRDSRGKESWFRRTCSLFFYKILDYSTRFDILQNVGDFRLLDRSCINALRKLRESERYTKGMFCWIGYRKKEILFDRGDRAVGKSNFNFLRLLNLAIEGITSFTTFPLRIATIIGGIVAFFAFIVMFYYGLKTVIFGDEVKGFTTIIVAVLLMGGIQLCAIGILGEYIGRIFNETKKRPTYLAGYYNEDKLY